VLDVLSADYREMVKARMFSADPPPFEVIVERLRLLEDEINRANS
jgi:hypothetical protein